MYFDYRARSGVLPILVAAAAIIAIMYFDFPAYVIALAGSVALVLGFVGVVKTIFYILENANHLLMQRNQARSITPESVLAEERAKLAAQVAKLDESGVSLVARGELFNIRIDFEGEQYIDDTGVPLHFAWDFFARSTNKNLAARTYFGGMTSQRYRWADTLTKYLIRKGAAAESRDGTVWRGGNQPAVWTSPDMRERLCRAWFDEPPPEPHKRQLEETE